MTTSRPLLSILIPTYNRAACLDFNLAHLCQQITPDLSDKIEVIVSDDCSPDNTNDILEKYKVFSFLKILRSPANMGADKNFLKSIQESTGQFVWLFGDDEVFFPEAIRKILRVLESNPAAGLIHIIQTGHASLEAFDKNKKHLSPSVEIMTNKNDFLIRINYYISFMSSHIFNRSYLREEIKPESFSGSSLVQEIFYLQAALFAPYNIFISDYYFSQLLNNTGGYRLFETFASNQQKVFLFFKSYGLQSDVIIKITNKMLRYFFPIFIFSSKMKGSKSFISESPFRILFKNFYGYINFWIFCFPIFMIPKKIAAQILYALQKLKRMTKGFF